MNACHASSLFHTSTVTKRAGASVLRYSSVRTNPSARANNLAQSPAGPYASTNLVIEAAGTSYTQTRQNTPAACHLTDAPASHSPYPDHCLRQPVGDHLPGVRSTRR